VAKKELYLFEFATKSTCRSPKNSTADMPLGRNAFITVVQAAE
jgi:hypothetical protein